MTGPLRVEIARTPEQLEELRPAWDQLPWHREEAAYPYFTTRLRTRAGVVGPFAAVVYDGSDAPVGGLAARIEMRRLATSVGYRELYAPTVRALQVVDGGIAAVNREAAAALAGIVEDALETGDAEAALLPPLEVGSELAAPFASLGGPLTRQPLIAPWTRRLLRLPGSFDEFLASRSHKTRKGIRRDARQLEAAFGDLSVEIVRDPADADRLVADAERVAQSSYQRRLGAGFADTSEQRELVAVGLDHGWLRGYLLHLEGRPVAYWLCSPFDRTTLLRTGAFDGAYAEHRVGIYLLMRVIEDACADPGLDVLDFGPGDAAYKEQYADETREERNAVVFAPTLRARRINATRTAILGPARLAKAGLDAAQLTSRVKTTLRRRAT